MTILLTPAKAVKLKVACQHLLATSLPSIRELARVIGKIVSCFPGVCFGPLYYRSLERDKITALQLNRWDFDKKATLSPQAQEELSWWVNNVTSSHNLLTRGKPSYTLTTDASKQGWGAVFGTHCTGGLWAAEESRNHINYLELLAVFLGLQAFCKSLCDTNIRLMIDNTTAVAVVNHIGTSHSDTLNKLGKQIWLWCIARNIWISASHIAGKSNEWADFESRQNKMESEWMLNTSVLSRALVDLDFMPEKDLFASRLNAQFTRYVAFRPDLYASAIDAFAMNWSDLNFYAFPPFSVIPAVLKNIKEDETTRICVLPYWPTQAWFALASKLATRKIIHLKPSKTLLHLPSLPNKMHPLHKQLALMVCLLSGKR